MCVRMSQMNQNGQTDGFERGAARDIGPRTEAMLARGEQVIFQVSGDSMRPTLKPRRDAVVLAQLEAWPPQKGDILFFRSDKGQGGYSLHRVYKLEDGMPVMNGDAQHWLEGPIPRDRVLAKAIVLLREGEPVDVDGRGYRVYVSLWRWTRPIRWPMFAVWRGIKSIFTE